MLSARAYGVSVNFSSENSELVEFSRKVALKALLGNIEFSETKFDETDIEFETILSPEGRFSLVIHGTSDTADRGSFEHAEYYAKYLNSMIRIYIAERAKNYVFIHAGVVVWKDRTVIIPGASFSGKTTLVAELLKLGAEYYSDEYAVLDGDGSVHPFARDLSIRTELSVLPDEQPPENFGATSGIAKRSVDIVLLTEYSEGSIFEANQVSVGNGILGTIPFVIPMRYNPDFSLKVLNTAFTRAIILQGLRGNADKAALSLIAFINKSIDLSN